MPRGWFGRLVVSFQARWFGRIRVEGEFEKAPRGLLLTSVRLLILVYVWVQERCESSRQQVDQQVESLQFQCVEDTDRTKE